jgi:hypothetical protein
MQSPLITTNKGNDNNSLSVNRRDLHQAGAPASHGRRIEGGA